MLRQSNDHITNSCEEKKYKVSSKIVSRWLEEISKTNILSLILRLMKDTALQWLLCVPEDHSTQYL